MDVVCSNCSAKYKINESKLGDRKKVRIKCKKCQSFIDIENPAFAKPKQEDIFEDYQAVPDASEFNFEDMKETLVLDTQKFQKPTQTVPKNNLQESDASSKSMQIHFSDHTSQVSMDMLKKQDQHIKKMKMEKKNSFQPQKNSFNPQGGGLNSKPSGNKNPLSLSFEKTTSNKIPPSTKNMGGANGGHIDKNMEKKFDNVANQYQQGAIQSGSSGGVIGKIIFTIFLLITLFFVFVLYKNNWELHIDKVPQMITNAFKGGEKSSKKVENKKVPISKQFIIDSKKVKIEWIKIRKSLYALKVKGEIKNRTQDTKNLATVKVDIFNIENKSLFKKRVYAGNIFDDKTIKKYKKDIHFDANYTQSGINGMNWGILPNQSIPFMFVFYTNKKIKIKDLRVELLVDSAQ